MADVLPSVLRCWLCVGVVRDERLSSWKVCAEAGLVRSKTFIAAHVPVDDSCTCTTGEGY